MSKRKGFKKTPQSGKEGFLLKLLKYGGSNLAGLTKGGSFSPIYQPLGQRFWGLILKHSKFEKMSKQEHSQKIVMGCVIAFFVLILVSALQANGILPK